jgi:hypothetical protein
MIQAKANGKCFTSNFLPAQKTNTGGSKHYPTHNNPELGNHFRPLPFINFYRLLAQLVKNRKSKISFFAVGLPESLPIFNFQLDLKF